MHTSSAAMNHNGGAQKRARKQHPSAYRLDPAFEATAVWLACNTPAFWAKVGRELEPELLGTDTAQLVIEQVGVLARERGKGPDSTTLVLQRLHRLYEEGKVTWENIQDVRALFSDAADHDADEGAIAAELTPVLKRRLQQQAAVSAMEDYSNARDFSRTKALIERANRLGKDPEKAGGASWTRLGAEDVFAPPDPIPWVLEALDIAPGAVTLLAGYGYSGKTVLAQALAVAMVKGDLAWETFPVKRGRVLHVDYEQGPRLTMERYRRLALGANLSAQDLAGQLEVVSMSATPLDAPNAEEVFASQCSGIDLCIVDSLRAAAPGMRENESDARRPLDMLARVSERTGCAFIVIHHSRKPSNDAPGGARMSIRGSGALYDAAQSVILLEAKKGEPPRLLHEKARNVGTTHDDLVIHIEDLSDPNAPKWGLRVKAELAAQADAAAVVEAEETTKKAVLDAVTAKPGLSSNELCAAVRGCRKDVMRAARDALEREQKIHHQRRPGRGGGESWHLGAEEQHDEPEDEDD